MNHRPQHPGWIAAPLALAAGAMVLLAGACATDRPVAEPLVIAGATYVGDQACADCHERITAGFAAAPHARASRGAGGSPGQSGCESCHGPGSKHIALGGRGNAEKYILNPKQDPAACLRCHLEVQTEFHLPAHHPVLEGKMSCVQCHDPHGSDIRKAAGGLAMARLNESCAACHREQTRPFIYEHPALREGCTACHNPHGAINAKLLTAPDSNLCLRCHAQVPGPGANGRVYIGGRDHTASLRLGSCWSAGCHPAVHGSNIHPLLLY